MKVAGERCLQYSGAVLEELCECPGLFLCPQVIGHALQQSPALHERQHPVYRAAQPVLSHPILERGCGTELNVGVALSSMGGVAMNSMGAWH